LAGHAAKIDAAQGCRVESESAPRIHSCAWSKALQRYPCAKNHYFSAKKNDEFHHFAAF
jgi:hypothetical protein